LIDDHSVEAMIRQAQQGRRAGVQPTSGDVNQAVSVTPRPAAPVAAVLPPLCPLCSSSMLTKMARRGPNTGRLFWSCKRYPVCHGTRPVSRGRVRRA
jgi:ssDNA-binding Zn-finger/Zn-ribbon topoisomerase 1